MLGDLISAGAKLIGGFMDREHAESQNELNFNRNAALAREFAQQGIRWKVEDAKAAGLHPLAALGVSTASGPSFTAGDVPSMGASLASMGQDVGRAINATRTADERTDAFTQAIQKQQLTRGDLENQLLASKIAQLKATQSPPAPTATGSDKMDPPPAPEHSGLRLGGDTSHNPRFSDAQKFEDRYGDLVQEFVGMGNVAADTYYSLTQSPWFNEIARHIQWMRNRGGPSDQVRSRWPRGNQRLERR